MPKPGPKPKPTALRVLEGETRPSRLNKGQPVPVEGEPVPPDHLDADALEVWTATLNQLRAMRLVTPADADALAAYCEAVVQRRRAYVILQKGGPLVKGQRGTMVRNPAAQAWRDAATTAHRLSLEFGLTPSARAAWRGPASTDDDDAALARLLSG